MVGEKHRWDASQMRQFIGHYTTLTGSVRKQDDADAGTSEYDRNGLLGLNELRQAAIELLR